MNETWNSAEERRGNPYLSSKRASTGPWYDSFAKNGEVVWLVFHGSELLAQVRNQQQCENLMKWLS